MQSCFCGRISQHLKVQQEVLLKEMTGDDSAYQPAPKHTCHDYSTSKSNDLGQTVINSPWESCGASAIKWCPLSWDGDSLRIKTTLGDGAFGSQRVYFLWLQTAFTMTKTTPMLSHVWRDHLGIGFHCPYCPHTQWRSGTSWYWHMNCTHPGASKFTDPAGIVKVKAITPVRSRKLNSCQAAISNFAHEMVIHTSILWIYEE